MAEFPESDGIEHTKSLNTYIKNLCPQNSSFLKRTLYSAVALAAISLGGRAYAEKGICLNEGIDAYASHEKPYLAKPEISSRFDSPSANKTPNPSFEWSLNKGSGNLSKLDDVLSEIEWSHLNTYANSPETQPCFVAALQFLMNARNAYSGMLTLNIGNGKLPDGKLRLKVKRTGLGIEGTFPF